MTEPIKLSRDRTNELIAKFLGGNFACTWTDRGHESIVAYAITRKPEAEESRNFFPCADESFISGVFAGWLAGLSACGMNFVVMRCEPTAHMEATGVYMLYWRAAIFPSREVFYDSDLAEYISESPKAPVFS